MATLAVTVTVTVTVSITGYRHMLHAVCGTHIGKTISSTQLSSDRPHTVRHGTAATPFAVKYAQHRGVVVQARAGAKGDMSTDVESFKLH